LLILSQQQQELLLLHGICCAIAAGGAGMFILKNVKNESKTLHLTPCTQGCGKGSDYGPHRGL
jgi:hypothetical protein